MPIHTAGSDVPVPADRKPTWWAPWIARSHAAQWSAAGAVVVVYGVLTGIHTGDSRGWIVFANSGELLAATLAMLACALRAVREHRADVERRADHGRAPPLPDAAGRFPGR